MTENEPRDGGKAPTKKPPSATDPFANETERGVARVFAEILDLEWVSPEDDIFTLGGDSFQAVRIALELEYRFSVEFPTELLERAWQVRELAEWISSQPRSTDTSAQTTPA